MKAPVPRFHTYKSENCLLRFRGGGLKLSFPYVAFSNKKNNELEKGHTNRGMRSKALMVIPRAYHLIRVFTTFPLVFHTVVFAAL